MGIRQQASGQHNGSGTFTVALPAASLPGSRVVVLIAGNTVVSTPAGWTLRTSQVNWMGHYLWDRAGGDTSWNFTASGQLVWRIVEIEAGVYVNALSQNDTATSLNYLTPTVTPSAGQRMLLASIGSTIDSPTVRTVSGWSNGFVESLDSCVPAGDYPVHGCADREVTASGAGYSTAVTFSSLSTGRTAIIAAYATATPATTTTTTTEPPTTTTTTTEPPATTTTTTAPPVGLLLGSAAAVAVGETPAARVMLGDRMVWGEAATTTTTTTVQPRTLSYIGMEDKFDDNGNVLWDAGIAYNAQFTNGRLVIPTAAYYPTIWALPHIDLTGRTVTVQLVTPPNNQSASNAYFQLGNWSDLSQYLGWMWTPDGTLTAEQAIPGITNRGTTTYAAGMWLRIGEAAGTVYWWTSTNGTAWTQRGSMPTAQVGFPITELQLKLGTGNWQGQTGLGAATWDNVEVTGDMYPVETPAHRIAQGFFVPQDNSAESIADIEAMTGTSVSHVLWFADVPNPVPTAALSSIVAAGRVPVVGLEPWDSTIGGPNQTAWKLSATIDGTHDTHYTRWANALKALPGEVWLRFAHEMNGTWYPWAAGGVNGNTNAQYVTAWRRVHGIFQTAGATNVKFMWAPNTHFGGAPHYADLYPGDAWVDLLGVDGYNWVEGADPARWRESPAALYSESLARLRALSPGKKIWIAECSTAEWSTQPGTYKADWIGKFFTYLQRQPELAGFLWFHILKEKDWRINSTPQASAAYAAAAQANQSLPPL